MESGQDSPGWAGMPATHGPVRIKCLREMGSRLPLCRCWSVFKQEWLALRSLSGKLSFRKEHNDYWPLSYSFKSSKCSVEKISLASWGKAGHSGKMMMRTAPKMQWKRQQRIRQPDGSSQGNRLFNKGLRGVKFVLSDWASGTWGRGLFCPSCNICHLPEPVFLELIYFIFH